MMNNMKICEIWGFHSREDSSGRFLGCDALWCCGRVQTFRRAFLPPSCEDGGRKALVTIRRRNSEDHGL